MKYHDFHIDKYEVLDRGNTIIFHLVYGYEGQKNDHSLITFTEVALYHFVHTDTAIITDLYETNILELIEEISAEVIEWNRMYRVKLWGKDITTYSAKLQSQDYKAWRIESAIGFYGFVIAKAIINS
jgi:hypothetical protein